MNLSDKKYKIIYADPPWRFKVWSRPTGLGRTADSHYSTMTLEDIKYLDIPADDDSISFLWVPCPMLKEGLEVIEAWGFEFKTVAFVWIKKNIVNGGLFWGMGYWTRANAEICLLGTKGKISRLKKNVHQVVMSPIKEHSRKPDEVRNRIVELMGDLPRIELFARDRVEGWDCWGDQLPSTSQRLL